MNTEIKRARIVGALFIIGTLAGMFGAGFLQPMLGSPDYLVAFSENKSQVAAGVLLLFTMAVACSCIAIWLYPLLKQYDESLALGAAGFRLMEGVIGFVNGAILLTLVTLSQEFVKAGAPGSSSFQSIGAALLAGSNWMSNLGILFPWCIGALMYYYIFYRTKLIPRWLTAWGLIGIILSLAACILFMFGLIDPSMPIHTLMNLPIFLQEMVMALWLIVKGFDQNAVDSLAIRVKGDKGRAAVNTAG